jgi:gliding motility-associated-like protein
MLRKGKMKGTLTYLLVILFGAALHGQSCPRISTPLNGSTGVPVDVTIRWPAVDGIVGYLISLGTTPGGTDILNRRSAGLTNSYTPEVGLPEDTMIYVTISLFLPDAPLIICPGESFRTVDVTTPPPCTRLADANDLPDNARNRINWAYASTATGYRITVGTSPGGSDIADGLDVGNVLSYRPSPDLLLDTDYYVQIEPYNENGTSGPCGFEVLNTTAPALDCDTFGPNIGLPQQIGLCLNDLPSIIASEANAEGYRWFRINEDSSETLISEAAEIAIDALGRYRLEAYNTVNQFSIIQECARSMEFVVIQSELAIIDNIALDRDSPGLRISVGVSGSGDYEYALDFENGRYQDSPVFNNVPMGEHTVYVRDKNGCGTSSRIVDAGITASDFPPFFTPNGDGVNDYWQFAPQSRNNEINVEYIRIFGRGGNFLVQIDPKSEGWDGNFQGLPLPPSDYWFKASTFNGQVVQGHFSLKR